MEAKMPKDTLLRVLKAHETILHLAYQDFLLSRQVMRCTSKTLAHYEYTAGGFVRWLIQHHITAPKDIRTTHIRSYLSEFSNKKDTTQHTQARGVKTFIRFLLQEHYCDNPDLARIQMPKLERRRLPCLNAEELQYLVEACDTIRDKALILLAVDTGLRLSELVALTWDDIDLKTGLVHVHRGKGGKARSVVLGLTTRRTLLAYERKRQDKTNALWVNDSGEPLSMNGIRQIFRRLRSRTGLPVTPHALRRTFALLSLRAGMSPLHLQALLGHTTLEMVRRYVQMVDQDLLQAHRDYGPVDRWLR